MVSRNTLSSAGPSVRKNKDDIDPSKSFILTLPTELLTMTLDNLKQVDLGMVRRTCKTLCGIATVIFARKIATTLRLDFSKEDMDRLVGLTGHPVFGPMLKSISFSTAQYNEIRHPYWKTSIHLSMVRKMLPHSFEIGTHIAQLTQALHNLTACQNKLINVGFHDIDHILKAESLWPFGISTIPVEESYSATMEAIGNAVEPSRFEVRRVNIYLETHHKDHEEIFTSNKFWRTIQSAAELCIDTDCCYDWSTTEVTSNRSKLTMTGHSLETNRKTTCYVKPHYLSKRYSQIWDMIYQDKYREICLKNCDAHYCVLSEFIGTTMSKVKHLELHRINILQSPYPQENGMPKATGITFCQCLQKLQNLESLKLYEIKNRAIGSIQSEQVHWEGQEQIQAGLNDLIGKMTTWEWNQ
ncbi:hypothetical protein D6C95_05883 [Aureobasidium pullulans]|nr:hypothetical protein D6C95_05883 [Aureobasidium pullulans]